MPALPHHHCPLCGGPNQCAPAQTGNLATPCWCRSARIDPAVLAQIPDAQRGRSCICPRCAAGLPACAPDPA